jgi:hypothetical protein
MRRIDVNKVEEEIRKLLEETRFPENIKNNLRESAIELFGEVEDVLPNTSYDRVARGLLTVACDMLYCVSSRSFRGRGTTKVSSKIREKVGVRPREPLEMVEPLVSYITEYYELERSKKCIETKAKEILYDYKSEAPQNYYSGSPTLTALAGIYIAQINCGEKLTQAEVCRAVEVTEVTLGNKYKEICRILGMKPVYEKRKFKGSRIEKFIKE